MSLSQGKISAKEKSPLEFIKLKKRFYMEELTS